MTSPMRAIIFDFGGVLLEWNPHRLYRRFFPDQPQAIDNFLEEINFTEWNAQQDKGRPFAQGVAELTAKFPQYAHLITAYHEYWEESIVGPITGTVNIATRLKQNGYPLFALSNWSAETYLLVKEKYEFFDLFDDIILSGEVGLIKPDPEIFRLTLKRIQRPASECLLIDDSITNINQAEKIGYNVIHFQSPEKLEKSLRDQEIL